MIISLIGYMGSGKSHISKILSKKMNLKLIDLDKKISLENNISIQQIFEKKGELYFRRYERNLLEKIFAQEDDCVLSLGGGTPAYYDNMGIINQNSESFYLNTSVKTLVERLLKQKNKRPLIANITDDALTEFVAKHLFERNPFYSRAKHTISTDEKKLEEIAGEIMSLITPGLFCQHR